MAFADDFRTIAVPRLKAAICVQATFLAMDMVGWSDAESAIWAEARKMGAGFLKEGIQDDLSDWISSNILREWAKAEARCAAIDAEIEASLATDPIAHYEGIASECSKPDVMRWVFASICPEYRAYLLSKRRSSAS